MTLQIAAASLLEPAMGLADIRKFALQCWYGAQKAGPEAAALVLLSEKANSFYERYEGMPMNNEILLSFVHKLAENVRDFRAATAAGDGALINALNAFAADFSTHDGFIGES